MKKAGAIADVGVFDQPLPDACLGAEIAGRVSDGAHRCLTSPRDAISHTQTSPNSFSSSYSWIMLLRSRASHNPFIVRRWMDKESYPDPRTPLNDSLRPNDSQHPATRSALHQIGDFGDDGGDLVLLCP